MKWIFGSTTAGVQSALLDVFDRVYVINLPTRKDRREEMEQQLRSVGASFADERVVLYPAVRPLDAGGFPSVGARGCFLSHLQVLRDAQKHEEAKNILILEDDCNFRKNIGDRLPGISNLLQLRGDVLFYGGEINLDGKKIAENINDLVEVPPTRRIVGAHCIGMHRKTAGRIADYLECMLQRAPGSAEGGPMHVDGAYSWFRKDNTDIRTWMSVPECVYQRSSSNDISGRRWMEKNPVTEKFVILARKMKNRMSS
ncbi:MAG: glycosyltransferase family 25 protein [Comamonadaceae bacterium]|nr:glycosyltransferase family 25 protein [Comamonadaceae bacterium]